MTKKVGTMYYSAPEILNEKNPDDYDNLCDIFSVYLFILFIAWSNHI